MGREDYVLILVILFFVSIFCDAIYTMHINPDIKEIEFKVFDYVRYTEQNIKIHTYGKGSFTIWGEIDVEIVEDAVYYLKYVENQFGFYKPKEIRRVDQ